MLTYLAVVIATVAISAVYCLPIRVQLEVDTSFGTFATDRKRRR